MSESHVHSLGEILQLLRAHGVEAELRGPADVQVTGSSQDSRTLRSGSIFLAWQGDQSDGHRFLGGAAAKGALAAIVEVFAELDLPQIRVSDGRRAAAIVSHALAGSPADTLQIAAVTGTNGKTTTAILLRHLAALRGPAAALGTLGVVEADGRIREAKGGLTTPGPVELAETLAELRRGGVEMVALEASSHALDQRRLDGIGVDVAVFTNLTRDHLDYHITFERYREAKGRLLGLLRKGGGVVLNVADPAWALLSTSGERVLPVRMGDEGSAGLPTTPCQLLPELIAEGVELSGKGSRFRLRWGGAQVEGRLPLLGRFNVSNALCALGGFLLLGGDLAEGVEGLSSSPPPLGRLEVTVEDPVPVILDYAHTPDALARALETIRPLYSGRIIVVFGAGGDRDREKRPLMGAVAARGADIPIVTSDNPRTEDPDAIVEEILRGMPKGGYERITDRRSAIERALSIARPGDAILLAGKGHETYQIIGREKRPFDERQVVREILGSGRAA